MTYLKYHLYRADTVVWATRKTTGLKKSFYSHLKSWRPLEDFMGAGPNFSPVQA